MIDFSAQVYDAETAARGESVVMLAYGAAGTGKTQFCGTAEKALLINTGSGVETILGQSKVKIIDVSEIVDEKSGIFKSALAFDKVCEIIDWGLTQDFQTIIVDDATFLIKFARNRALEINADTGKSQSLATSRAQGISMMAIQDFGTEMGVIEWFLATYVPLFKAAKRNFILTAHERYFYGKKEKPSDPPTIRKTVPAFTGQAFPDTIPAFFDLVWRFKTVGSMDGVKYRAYTAGSEDEAGKSRYKGIFKSIEENPTFPDVLRRIKLPIVSK